MKNSKLLAILRAFKILFENLPSNLPDKGYDSAFAQFIDGYRGILYALLRTRYFALNTDSSGECVSIFSAESKRDAYIEEIYKSKEECEDCKITCVPIAFKKFINVADGEELDLNNYSLDENGAIEFIPFSAPESKFHTIF